MDTSVRVDAESFLAGTARIRNEEIPPRAWFHRIWNLYHSPVVGNVRGLFKTIAEHMTDQHVAPVAFPHGLTAFDPGLSIHTNVAACGAGHVYAGEQLFENAPTVWSHTTATFLLILKPPACGPLEWAEWTFEFQRIPKAEEDDGSRLITNITASRITWLERAEDPPPYGDKVTAFFETHPHVPLCILDKLAVGIYSHHRHVRQELDELGRIGECASGMRNRVKY